MRVLVLHSELGVLRGGGENFTRNLFSAFARAGHDVSAAFVADRDGRYPIPVPTGITPLPLSGWWSRKLGQPALSAVGRRVTALGVPVTSWERVQDAICWRTIEWHQRRFQRRVEAAFARDWKSYDAVYVHGDALLAAGAARHRPTILRLPGPIGIELAPALRAVNAVCANGDALQRMRAWLGDAIQDLPPGLDEQRFHPGASPIRAALGWSAQDAVVGYVGRLTSLKGVDLLAEGFRRAAQTLPRLRLLVVGSGELDGELRAALAGEMARGAVHIESDVAHEELADWYRAMSLFVMPSRYENFSNSVLEALACGVPVLASSVGGNTLLAETGAGWLFDCGSSASLAGELIRTVGEHAELARRGSLGAHYVRGRYSWKATSARLETIIAAHLPPH